MKSYVVMFRNQYGGDDWLHVQAASASEAARKAGKAWGLKRNELVSVTEGTDPWNLSEGDAGSFYADGRPY